MRVCGCVLSSLWGAATRRCRGRSQLWQCSAPPPLCRRLLSTDIPADTVGEAGASAAASGVHLDRYPLHLPESAAYAELVRAARADLAATGCAAFPGFITAAATEQAAEEVRAATSTSFSPNSHHACHRSTNAPCGVLYVAPVRILMLIGGVCFVLVN